MEADRQYPRPPDGVRAGPRRRPLQRRPRRTPPAAHRLPAGPGPYGERLRVRAPASDRPGAAGRRDVRIRNVHQRGETSEVRSAGLYHGIVDQGSYGLDGNGALDAETTRETPLSVCLYAARRLSVYQRTHDSNPLVISDILSLCH